MPFDSQGNFSRVHNWEQDRINGIKIVSDRHDQEDDNFADGFDLCFIRDGRAAMTGNLNAGGFQVKNMIAGSSSTDAVNKGQLDTLQTTLEAYADAIIPKGVIIPFGGTTAPTGFLMCDGTAVSRTTYADLFAVIGTAYGSGDGSTTFNLPDFTYKQLPASIPVKGNGIQIHILKNGGSETGIRTAFEEQGSHKGFLQGTGWASTQDNLPVSFSTNASKTGVVGDTTSFTTCNMIIKY